MAIAHVATEYVFSDFLLKDPNPARYRSIRTELAVDKMVTCVAVGLPLLLISLAFAQEVSVGTQISCFSPSNFSWRQAMYVDSFCWAAVHTHTTPLWLHKFFPYILLLVAVLMYTPALFWRFLAAPLLQSDLGFIMEELDRCYNRAVTLSKRLATTGLLISDSDSADDCFNYPLLEKFLLTKRSQRSLLLVYLFCRGLTFVTLLIAIIYLVYYLHLASVIDDFGCSLRVGLLLNDTSVPEQVQCKMIAVGVFSLLSLVNLVLFVGLVPVVIFSSLRPFFCHKYAHFLEIYQSLPTVSVLPAPAGQWDDLSLYLLFLEENLSELKSYKYIKVLEMLRRRDEYSGENFDPVKLLQALWLVKLDNVDGNKKGNREKTNEEGTTTENHTNAKDESSMEMEMKELNPLLTGNSDVTGSSSKEGRTVRQRAM
ncbi:pannexin-1-like [Pholidichthys leucotaenia]